MNDLAAALVQVSLGDVLWSWAVLFGLTILAACVCAIFMIPEDE